jgi:DNA-binding transcriptional regulator LsrR (DeoR family)
VQLGRAFEPGDPEALAQANEAKQAGIEARRAQVAELSDQDMTQSEIAQALGVSRSTIKRDLAAVHNGHINGHSQ